MTTAEQIATGPYTVERHESAMSIAWTVVGPTDPHEWFRSEKAAQFECDRLNAAYTRGQQDRWISVDDKVPDYNIPVLVHQLHDITPYIASRQEERPRLLVGRYV